MVRVLVVATSRKTRGGITAVIKAHETGGQWKKYHCHWVQTHRDGATWRKILYLLFGWIDFVVRIPFYDIVHCHISLQTTVRRKLPFMRLAKLLHKKTIVHLHCGSQIHSIWNKNYDYIFNEADMSVFLSHNLQLMVEEHTGHSSKYRVLYNPCPKISITPVVEKHKTILFSGTLYLAKGYVDLLKAFSKMARKFPDWKVVFAGNGEIENGKCLAGELGISSQVLWLGWVSGADKDRAFRESSIFCLPSYAEGFPMAVLDAWAYGLPVITTPVGGIPDIAKDGDNMLLFNPGDIDKLAEQLERMIVDVALRKRIAAASVDFAANQFNVNTINAQLGDLYEELSR